MEERRICGECRYHTPKIEATGKPCDWWCQNIDSENCAMFTDYDDTCEAWESRGIE